MTQPRLPFPKPPQKRARREPALDSNQESARIILSDPARYGGESALPVQWARLLLSRR